MEHFGMSILAKRLRKVRGSAGMFVVFLPSGIDSAYTH